MQPSAYIFFGRSGSGKGTQAKLLIEYLEKHDSRKVLYVETGRLLRAFGDKYKTYASTKTKEIIEAGGLLPEFVPICIWGDYLINNATGNEHFVFDGVSRRIPEAPILHSALNFFSCPNREVIFINTSKEWSRERLLSRGRKDDDREEIDRRLQWFDDNVRPTIAFYENNPDYVFNEVSGEQSIENVHKDILKKIGA